MVLLKRREGSLEEVETKVSEELEGLEELKIIRYGKKEDRKEFTSFITSSALINSNLVPC